MTSTLYCYNQNSKKLYHIELGITLINFIEFSFESFEEQVLTFFKAAESNGSFDTKKLSSFLELILPCHPYINSASDVFKNVAIDFYIDYLSKEKSLSFDEMWEEYVSPSNKLQRSVFERLSEYRTKSGYNTYKIVKSLQKYACEKVSFIFDEYDCSFEKIKSKKAYCNFIIASADSQLLNQSSNITVISDPFYLFSLWSQNSLTNTLYDNIGAKLLPIKRSVPNCNHNDCYYSLIFDELSALITDESTKYKDFLDSVPAAPDCIYMPQSFTAAINLEFDKIIENESVLIKCARCGKYFIKNNHYHIKYCDRVDENGRSCKDFGATEAFNQKRKTDDIEKKCHCVYNTIHRRIDKDLTYDDFKIWAAKLSELKQKLKSDESQKDAVLNYLNDSLERFGGKRKSGRPKDNEE